MQTRSTMKRLALAFLLPVVAVAVGIGLANRGDDTDPAQAAPPVAVRALAPDLYDYFIDGDNDTLSALAITPSNGLNVGELLAGDQSGTLGGNMDLYPDAAETALMEAFGATDVAGVGPVAPPQMNISAGQAGLAGLDGKLAIAAHLPGKACSPTPPICTPMAPPYTSEVGNVTYGTSVGPGAFIYGEAAAAAGAPHGMGPVDPTLATAACGSIFSYFAGADPVTGAGKADFPDGDCDGVIQGPMDYSGAILGPVTPPDGPGGVFDCFDYYLGGLAGPAPNDPTCREDSLVIAHLLIASPATPLAAYTASFTQAAAPAAGADGLGGATAGGVGMAAFEVVGDPVAVAHVQNPDCSGTIAGCVPDPMTIGNAAPGECLPQPSMDLNSGAAILAWDAIDGTDTTLSTAFSTPLTITGAGPKPVTRDHMTWDSDDDTIVHPQENFGVSFNIPDALPGALAGITGADLLCSGAVAGTANITVTGSFSASFPVSVADVTSLKLDMDINNGGGACDPIDSSTTATFPGPSFQVGVCLTNPTGTDPVAAFGYNVTYNDTIILAPEVADVGTGLDDNPDANVGGTTFTSLAFPNDLGSGWDCTGGVGAYPKGDNNAAAGAGNGNAFSGGCGSAAGPNTLLEGPLGVITFDVVGTGVDTLGIVSASITGDSLNEIGSCNPTVDVAMLCVGGEVTVGEPPPPTDTPTFTPTNTPTDTPTPTNTPAGPTVNKDPAIANLWICEVGPCDGPGEGDVVIQEIVNNVSEPLGAWEIQIKFDHKIFNVSIDPNEALFTDDGRTPDCNIQVVTENWILFGCVSTGPVGAGYTSSGGIPVGPAVLATITLTPSEDLSSRLHPGNDNGLVRLILDENCEVADTLGHPQPGSVNGGLALECGDASITVRILEGDLDLDCDVDVADEQLIAGKYGTFFGNIFYDPWFDLEPALKDFDIDIKDLQKVFGRDGSTCQAPIPPQPPVEGMSVGPL